MRGAGGSWCCVHGAWHEAAARPMLAEMCIAQQAQLWATGLAAGEAPWSAGQDEEDGAGEAACFLPPHPHAWRPQV